VSLCFTISLFKMTLQDKSDIAPINPNLGQAAAQFLLELPPADRPKAQQEISKLVRWYGEDRQLSEVTIPEAANYAEQITSSTTEVVEKLAVAKNFLTYCYKKKLMKTNLAIHLKSKKTTSKPTHHSRRYHRRAISLTDQGYANLQAELVALMDERPRIVEELKKAAADKDFRENAPLEAARERQAHIEGRIRELESTLKTATIMDDKQSASHEIAIGDTIMLIETISGEEVTYTLVDMREANPDEGKISVVSPVGQAVLGRRKGDKVAVRAPAGIIRYEIKNIKHR
jgi:transcription elongation factor GreA